MGNTNGGLNMEQVDNAMAAGMGNELATAIVEALQSMSVTDGSESSKNEHIVAGLTEVFDNAQQKFPGMNFGGSDLAAGVAEIVSMAQNAITETPEHKLENLSEDAKKVDATNNKTNLVCHPAPEK